MDPVSYGVFGPDLVVGKLVPLLGLHDLVALGAGVPDVARGSRAAVHRAVRDRAWTRTARRVARCITTPLPKGHCLACGWHHRQFLVDLVARRCLVVSPYCGRCMGEHFSLMIDLSARTRNAERLPFR